MPIEVIVGTFEDISAFEKKAGERIEGVRREMEQKINALIGLAIDPAKALGQLAIDRTLSFHTTETHLCVMIYWNIGTPADMRQGPTMKRVN